MEIHTTKYGNFHLIRIIDDIAVTSDIAELRDCVEELLEDGARNIAIGFTKESYLSSRSASILIACFEMIKEKGGELAIIRPNPTILHLLTIIDLEGVIRIVNSDEALLDIPNLSSAQS